MKTTPLLSVSATIDAPPARLYDIVADYQVGHPDILPRPPFVSLDVVEGGVGEGTVIRVGMKVLGRVQTFVASVTEPEPGRRLVESSDTGYVTTFTFDPVAGGTGTTVCISTEVTGRGPIAGRVERALTSRMLRPVYEKELANLAEVARSAPGKAVRS